jgi:hypothetical protein
MRDLTLIALALSISVVTPASADLFSVGDFEAYGDFRFRAESDWESRDASRVSRDDRTRLRIRLRTGFTLDFDDHWRVEARLRSGAENSHQSPHVTIVDLDDNDTGDASFQLDRWYVQGTTGGLYAWAGRNSLPIWKQNEMLFDDDVTMAGLGVGWKENLGPGQLSLGGGYFSPPVGMRAFSGNLTAAQIAYAPELAGTRWTMAVGLFLFDADPDDPDAADLLQGNGFRDYAIQTASVQARFSVADRPLTLGGDLLRNDEGYSASDLDPFTAANHDQTDGYVLQATCGGLSDRGDWLLGYYYANIEALAVNNSYAQDDWVRWGSATQTRGSDMKGHELRVGWALNAKMNLLFRVYLVEAITSTEDGNRARIDFNYGF